MTVSPEKCSVMYVSMVMFVLCVSLCVATGILKAAYQISTIIQTLNGSNTNIKIARGEGLS